MTPTSQLMPTFNRVLAFDRQLDRLANWNGQRAFVPSLDVVERAGAYLRSAEPPRVRPQAGAPSEWERPAGVRPVARRRGARGRVSHLGGAARSRPVGGRDLV